MDAADQFLQSEICLPHPWMDGWLCMYAVVDAGRFGATFIGHRPEQSTTIDIGLAAPIQSTRRPL